jgi:uncharacterized protein (UPF0264 family)
LVSVRDADEAREALAGGAQWIDLKEPRRGALGPVDGHAAREVVACVAGRVPVSAAAGELVDWPYGAARSLLGAPGVSYLKLGLSNCATIDWQPMWNTARAEIAASSQRLVAVIYADAAAESPPPEDVLAIAASSQCDFALWDTFDKSAGPLQKHLTPTTLADLLGRARTRGLGTAVAGGLDARAIVLLPWELVDIVAVRGAVCLSSRTSTVCRERVAEICRSIVDRHETCSLITASPT